MVAVICSPSQCKLRKVACAEHHAVLLVGKVHKYLCALSGLRVLVSHIVVVGVLAYVVEMLGHCGCDGNLAHGHPQPLHQFNGI